VAVSESFAVSIEVVVSITVAAIVPVAVTLEVLKELVIITAATKWCLYLQVSSGGMYSHMFK
jgi:hypothetical protein